MKKSSAHSKMELRSCVAVVKNHCRNPIDCKVLDNEETVFKQRKKEQTDHKRVKRTHKCDNIQATVATVDDEKRQNKRRLSEQWYRTNFLFKPYIRGRN